MRPQRCSESPSTTEAAPRHDGAGECPSFTVHWSRRPATRSLVCGQLGCSPCTGTCGPALVSGCPSSGSVGLASSLPDLTLLLSLGLWVVASFLLSILRTSPKCHLTPETPHALLSETRPRTFLCPCPPLTSLLLHVLSVPLLALSFFLTKPYVPRVLERCLPGSVEEGVNSPADTRQELIHLSQGSECHQGHCHGTET